MAARDPVVLALASIAAGAGAGGAVITAGLVALRVVQARRGITPQDDLAFGVLSVALFAGVAAAAAIAWRLTGAIEDYWRRGVTGALAVTLAFGLAGGAVPVDLVAGRMGLGAYAVALVAAGTWALHWARRAA